MNPQKQLRNYASKPLFSRTIEKTIAEKNGMQARIEALTRALAHAGYVVERADLRGHWCWRISSRAGGE